MPGRMVPEVRSSTLQFAPKKGFSYWHFEMDLGGARIAYDRGEPEPRFGRIFVLQKR